MPSVIVRNVTTLFNKLTLISEGELGSSEATHLPFMKCNMLPKMDIVL